MPEFAYQALNNKGKTISGVIEAATISMAENIIATRGYTPLKVKKANSIFGLSILSKVQITTGRVNANEMILFTKQLRSMLNAGVPVVRLLNVLESQTQNRALKETVNSMKQKVKQGLSLFECMENHPAVFSHLYRSMVRAGELSGDLPAVLDRLVYIIEHENKVRSDVKAALRYPIVVVCSIAVAFFILTNFVIPRFATMFQKAGLSLPIPTRVAIRVHDFLSSNWQILVIGVAVLIFAIIYALRSEEGKYTKDKLFLQIPIFGPLMVKAAMARFASVLSIMYASGVSIIDSLDVLSGTIGNSAISRTFKGIRERMQEGYGIAEPLKSAKYFTPMIINMVAIGEETGSLDSMLREITKHYDDELEFTVKGLSESIGPVLVVILAGLVGFFALAVFMPMWDMHKVALK